MGGSSGEDAIYETLSDILEQQDQKGDSYDKERFFRKRLRFLDKIGKRHEALADIDKRVDQHIMAQIYMDRKEYDKLVLFCRRRSYNADEYLEKYGKYMPLDDQKEVAEYIADRTKRCIADCKRCKDYAYHVQRIQDMIDACEGGKIVAKELVPYLCEHYGNRPALIGMLRQLKGLEDYGNGE